MSPPSLLSSLFPSPDLYPFLGVSQPFVGSLYSVLSLLDGTSCCHWKGRGKAAFSTLPETSLFWDSLPAVSDRGLGHASMAWPVCFLESLPTFPLPTDKEEDSGPPTYLTSVPPPPPPSPFACLFLFPARTSPQTYRLDREKGRREREERRRTSLFPLPQPFLLPQSISLLSVCVPVSALCNSSFMAVVMSSLGSGCLFLRLLLSARFCNTTTHTPPCLPLCLPGKMDGVAPL